MAEQRLFDFHVHGGDAGRVGEIWDYMACEGLEGLVLLSMPLSGIPNGPSEPANLNVPVLESKRLLNTRGRLDSGYSGPGVFAFGSLDNRGLLQGRTGSWEPGRQAADMAEAGFDGLKLWEGKPELASGLGIMPDDGRLVECCQEAGRLAMPVLFHVADPPEFWNSGGNEPPGGGSGIPSFESLIRGAERLCEAAPETIFVFPHMLFLAENLSRAAAFLNDSPHAFFDMAPGNYFYGPLSADPDRSAEFFAEYARRILFGSDSFFFPGGFDVFPGETLAGNRRRCGRLREFLSSGRTIDNPYSRATAEHRSVRGLELPESVLTAIFSGNAAELLPDSPKEVKV